MRDASLSATLVFAATCWALGAIFIGIGFFWPHTTATVGLYFTAMAATAHMKTFFIYLERREREAFELGRDSVRPLR